MATRITPEQWAQARAMREAGASLGAVADMLGVHPSHVSKRAKREDWGDGTDSTEAIRRRALERSHLEGITDRTKNVLLDVAAERLVGIVHRHRREWEQVVALRQEALSGRAEDPKEAFERAKLAKITAEMTAIQQTGERRAWGLDKAEGEHTITIERAYG